MVDGQSVVFTGIRVKRCQSAGYVTMDQHSHIRKVIRTMGWESLKERDIPIAKPWPTADDRPTTAEEKDEASRQPYRSVLGCTGWTVNTHIDGTLAWKILASRSHDHGKAA